MRDPDDPSIVSRFKNLAHHHFHQRSRAEANSFWGACGAVRRDCFFAAGEFDEKRFKLPSIEDVELGYRMIDRGVRIVLDPELQVKHLKKWTLTSLIATDVTRRAIPWTLLWMERRRMQKDLNFSYDQRIARVGQRRDGDRRCLLAIGIPYFWLIGRRVGDGRLWLNRESLPIAASGRAACAWRLAASFCSNSTICIPCSASPSDPRSISPAHSHATLISPRSSKAEIVGGKGLHSRGSAMFYRSRFYAFSP